jgi:hypothetical protein
VVRSDGDKILRYRLELLLCHRSITTTKDKKDITTSKELFKKKVRACRDLWPPRHQVLRPRLTHESPRPNFALPGPRTAVVPEEDMAILTGRRRQPSCKRSIRCSGYVFYSKQERQKLSRIRTRIDERQSRLETDGAVDVPRICFWCI